MRIPFVEKFREWRNDLISDLKNPKKWLMDALSGRKSFTGVYVSEANALKYIALFACIRIISETIASLPLKVYGRLGGGGKEEVRDYPLYPIMHDSPNPEMTAFTFRETSMAHILTGGNRYSEIVKDGYGNTLELWPLLPNKMRVERIKGVMIYHYTLPDGTEVIIPKDFIMHIPGLGFDGRIGYSPIRMAQEAIGMGLAAEEYGARFFGQGTNIGGIVEHPGQLRGEAFDNLQKSLEKKYEGLGKAHRLMILEEGMKYQRATISPGEAQLIESRRFQLEEVARLYRIPLHMLQDLIGATFSNIEHQSIDFVIHCIRPWLVRLEQSYHMRLIRPEDKSRFFIEHSVDGLLRGDTKTRYEAYHTARMDGWLNGDEIRALENMNPMENGQGKIYTVQLNMIDLKMMSVGSGGSSRQIILDDGNGGYKALALRSTNERAGGLTRLNIAHSYKKIIVDSSLRVVRREKEKILKEAKKIFSPEPKRDLADKVLLFRKALEEFYLDFNDYLIRQVKPVFFSLAEAIYKEAMLEANSSDDLNAELQSFMEEYTKAFGIRYSEYSKGKLKKVVDQAIEEKEKPLEVVESELNKWEEKRPNRVAMEENVKINGAVSRAIWILVGISLFVWRNTGSQTCPYCKAMNGKIVGRDEKFLPAGVDFNPPGADGSMKIRGPKSHPPLHKGCDCSIEISTE